MTMNTGIRKMGVRTTIWLALWGLIALPVGCQSLWGIGEGDNDANSFAVPSDLLEQSSRLSLLSLRADDYQGLSARGTPVQWHPILMPLRSHLSLSDRDFLLGIANPLGSIEESIPAEGQCRMFVGPNSSNATPLPEATSENKPADVRLELRNPDGTASQNALSQSFFIHDQLSRNVKAIGFWDEQGQAVCPLPAGRWFVSTGFGEARSHKAFVTTAGKPTVVPLRHQPR
ncbi:MAG: hypothetical protein RIR26_807, partial [Pseudomonadota bacterium]